MWRSFKTHGLLFEGSVTHPCKERLHIFCIGGLRKSTVSLKNLLKSSPSRGNQYQQTHFWKRHNLLFNWLVYELHKGKLKTHCVINPSFAIYLCSVNVITLARCLSQFEIYHKLLKKQTRADRRYLSAVPTSPLWTTTKFRPNLFPESRRPAIPAGWDQNLLVISSRLLIQHHPGAILVKLQYTKNKLEAKKGVDIGLIGILNARKQDLPSNRICVHYHAGVIELSTQVWPGLCLPRACRWTN